MLSNGSQYVNSSEWDYAGTGYAYPFLSQFYPPDQTLESQSSSKAAATVKKFFCNVCHAPAVYIFKEDSALCLEHDEYLTQNSKIIGQIILEKRQQLYYSRTVLSRMSEVGVATIQRYETGENQIQIYNLIKIANALETEIKRFFERKQENVEIKPQAAIFNYTWRNGFNPPELHWHEYEYSKKI